MSTGTDVPCQPYMNQTTPKRQSLMNSHQQSSWIDLDAVEEAFSLFLIHLHNVKLHLNKLDKIGILNYNKFELNKVKVA